MQLWSPPADRVQRAQITAFIAAVSERWRVAIGDAHALYEWSIRYPEKFWESVWTFCGILAHEPWRSVLEDREKMPGARWFPGATLNFAENLLRYDDDRPAIISWDENCVRREISFRELRGEVAKFAAYLRSIGVVPGDRVAALIPNIPEAIIGMLAATSIGAVWSSCSPDFGPQGVLDRFSQVTPRVLLVTDGYLYKGRSHDLRPKVREVLVELPSVEKVVVVPFLESSPDLRELPRAVLYTDAIKALSDAPLIFAHLPFDHPVYILYSSGTTGKPKCIVHRAGGVLIEHLKELKLHTDLTRNDRIFYHTTCGWMMWNFLVSSLAVGSTVVIYDGFPLHHDGSILWEMAAAEGVTVFGTSAKYLAELEKHGIHPGRSFDLAALSTILSTGSPLSPESFDFVYREIKRDLCLSSISGGTDIVGCFALGCPAIPVHRGELQIRSLGLKVEVFSSAGKSVRGEKGELVCSAPFPSMPLGFWNDEDGTKFHRAYFERFPGVWHHGDYVELTSHLGMIFYGRSDAVLNPGGIRIGTAEIYRVVEQLPEIAESIAIAQEWKGEDRVVLFVKLREGCSLNDELVVRIREALRHQASPHHVPQKILAVSDIPRTRSGKITELAVRDLVHGRVINNREALLNPEALHDFENRSELAVD